MVAGHVRLDISCLDRLYQAVILSPAARRAADLGGRVEDSVLDAAVAVLRSSSAMA